LVDFSGVQKRKVKKSGKRLVNTQNEVALHDKQIS